MKILKNLLFAAKVISVNFFYVPIFSETMILFIVCANTSCEIAVINRRNAEVIGFEDIKIHK